MTGSLNGYRGHGGWLLAILPMTPVFGDVDQAVAAPPAGNKMCPVMTLEEVDPEITLTYQGRTVGFCCDRCLSKFKANPDKYVDRLPQFADASSSVAADSVDANGGHGHEAEAEHQPANAGSSPKSNSRGHEHGKSEGDADRPSIGVPACSRNGVDYTWKRPGVL